MKQNKAPVLAALDAMLETINQIDVNPDDVDTCYADLKKARADLQKWVDDVPYEAQEYVELYYENLENSALTPIMRAAKHLLKGIKNK